MDNNLYIFIVINDEHSLNFMHPNFVNEISNSNHNFFKKIDDEIASITGINLNIIIKQNSKVYEVNVPYKSFLSITYFISELYKSNITKSLPTITLKAYPLFKNNKDDYYLFSGHNDFNFQLKRTLSEFNPKNTEIEEITIKYIDDLFDRFCDEIEESTIFKVEVIHKQDVMTHTYSSDIPISNQKDIIYNIINYAFSIVNQITEK